MSSAGGSVKVIIIALFANLGIALSKLVGAIISGSASLLAEAIHSFVDCTNQALLLVGNKAASKAPSIKHPLGYGREAFFWSFIVAILLFSLGGVFSVYEGIHKLSSHEPMESPLLVVIILLIAIGLESYSFKACINEVKHKNRFGSLWAWFKKTTEAELLVIFTEDLAALLGLIFALVCVSVAWATGNPLWDAIGSIMVGVLLVSVALLLSVEIKSLIIGEAPSIDLRPAVESIVSEKIPGGRVLALLALQTGASEIMLSYKITPGSMTNVKSLIDSINEVEAEVKSRFPEVKWQFVEPDNHE
ncbi:MAG: cation diffusion facilitator family transporter [Nitrospinae bacterium]|nr:cation diffusion facilitator family transporter [Nitrospinota bacterium]